MKLHPRGQQQVSSNHTDSPALLAEQTIPLRFRFTRTLKWDRSEHGIAATRGEPAKLPRCLFLMKSGAPDGTASGTAQHVSFNAIAAAPPRPLLSYDELVDAR